MKKFMRSIRRSLEFLALMVFISTQGCGKGNTGFDGFYTGTVTGSVNSNTVSGTYTMTTHVNGTTTSGTWFITSPASYGNLSGTVNGSTMTATLTPAGNTLGSTPFTGAFTLNGTQAGLTFSGGSGTTNAAATLALTQ